MSTENPFADPEEENPFGAPVIQTTTLPSPPPYIPAPVQPPPPVQAPAPAPLPSPPQKGPVTYGTTDSSTTSIDINTSMMRPSSPRTTSAFPDKTQMDEELRKQKEELDKREARLKQSEQQFEQEQKKVIRQNNFPPLPAACCVQPCFYQDFDIDIPLQYQKIVKTIYYSWIAYVAMLILNLLGAISYFGVTMHVGGANCKNQSGSTFGLSLLFLLLFAPCSFVCWYRPLYKGFKCDSSINFFAFFFVIFAQFLTNIVFFLGADGSGMVGLISGLSLFTSCSSDGGGSSGSVKSVATLLIIIGCMFGLLAVGNLFTLIKVHRLYRQTGASFQQAQAELAKGVMSNKAMREAAATAVSSGVQSAMSGQDSPKQNRY